MNTIMFEDACTQNVNFTQSLELAHTEMLGNELPLQEVEIQPFVSNT